MGLKVQGTHTMQPIWNFLKTYGGWILGGGISIMQRLDGRAVVMILCLAAFMITATDIHAQTGNGGATRTDGNATGQIESELSDLRNKSDILYEGGGVSGGGNTTQTNICNGPNRIGTAEVLATGHNILALALDGQGEIQSRRTPLRANS